jgi:hypothetical protein
LKPGLRLSSQVEAGSALGISAGKSSPPIWLRNASSTVDWRRIEVPSSSPPRSSARWNLM